MKKLLLTCAVLALAPACARTQKLVINSNVPGAQISIVKRGEIRNRAKVAGTFRIAMEEKFEDAPIIVGSAGGAAPLVYEFPVVEDRGGWEFFGMVKTHERRICEQVEVRAFNGTQFAQQTLWVTGDVAQVNLVLPPPQARPASAHAATPVPPPGS